MVDEVIEGGGSGAENEGELKALYLELVFFLSSVWRLPSLSLSSLSLFLSSGGKTLFLSKSWNGRSYMA